MTNRHYYKKNRGYYIISSDKKYFKMIQYFLSEVFNEKLNRAELRLYKHRIIFKNGERIYKSFGGEKGKPLYLKSEPKAIKSEPKTEAKAESLDSVGEVWGFGLENINFYCPFCNTKLKERIRGNVVRYICNSCKKEIKPEDFLNSLFKSKPFF